MKSQLREMQRHIDSSIQLAKSKWYEDICNKIHNMRFDPKKAWEYINILTKGETAHYRKRHHMRIRMEDGKLSSNAKETISIFGKHFASVYNNDRPVDFTVLDMIRQRNEFTHLDNPITFEEVDRAIKKLKSGKAAGLNGIPPEAFKAMNRECRERVHKYIPTSMKANVTMKDGIRVSVYRSRKVETYPTQTSGEE